MTNPPQTTNKRQRSSINSTSNSYHDRLEDVLLDQSVSLPHNASAPSPNNPHERSSTQ